MSILLVEPDRQEAERLAAGLAKEGFACAWSADGQGILNHTGSLSALVMELALPEGSGLDLIRSLRKGQADLPVLIHAARCSSEDRVLGLEAGADDFLCKPCTVAELAARLRAVLRRRRPRPRQGRIRLADLVWEPALRRVSRGGKRLDLTPKEYALLALLLEHRGEVVERDRLALALWGASREGLPEVRSPNALDAQIRRLRAKLDVPGSLPLLHTLRGQGLIIESGEASFGSSNRMKNNGL